MTATPAPGNEPGPATHDREAFEAQDGTEIKSAEARLMASERRYRALFESIVDGIFIVGMDGKIVDANPVAYTRLGYTREEFLALNVRELNTPEYAARVSERFREIKERGPTIFESAHRRKDGTLMPVEVNGRLFDYGGRSVYFSVVRDITERKRAEEELAGQRTMLQQIFDTSSVAIALVDLTGRITHANRCMAEMFGRTLEELIGREYVALVHPAEREVGRAKMLALLGSEIPSVDLERRYLRSDGTEFWGHLTCRRFYDAHGTMLGLVGVISDVTERRRAEEALRKNERMLQAIIDTEPECVKLLDAEARLTFMNRAGLDMIQADSLDQVKGQCVCPMVDTAHRQAFLDLTKRVFRGEPGELLFELDGLRGRHLWLETRAVPLRDEREEIVAMLGVTRDVTERKLAAEALRSSETRFRSIIENASVGILVADVETGKFRYANPAICRLLGYEAREFTSLVTTDLAVVEELAESIAGFRAHVEGRRRATERTFRRKDGSTVRVSINSVPMEFDGRACLLGFFVDITERRLLEAERLRAQKLESIGTLAGGIAHDFNNLLQGVFGYLSMAKLSLDRKEKANAMLEQAEKALHQSVNLTTQLLTFSKGGKPVRKLIDLHPVIENAVKFALSGSRVTWGLCFAEDLPAVEADEGQIAQVVQNIVLNAEQAMPLGGRIEVSVRTALPARAAELSLPADGGLVEIEVRDQGIGIPEAHLPRIFDPYFTTKEKGSGLGLATSYSIVRNHEGEITVRSELGKGTTFSVFLPAATAALEQAARVAVQPSCAACRVLVMDDEELVRTVAGELLRALGHEPTFAEDGAAAIAQYTAARAAGRPFDVVVLDLTIRGGMGGEETLRRLRELDPAVKAIVSSGYSDDEVAASFRKHGFRAFLKKPYSIRELSSVLAEVLA
jgi:two-component system, cell cycle sensor histidine kinase and response regulator CckA